MLWTDRHFCTQTESDTDTLSDKKGRLQQSQANRLLYLLIRDALKVCLK